MLCLITVTQSIGQVLLRCLGQEVVEGAEHFLNPVGPEGDYTLAELPTLP